MPYQRGQFWLRRFRRQAESLCAALATLTAPAPASSFRERALGINRRKEKEASAPPAGLPVE